MGSTFKPALETKVASRMATLFFICAGLPLAALALLTITQTTSELDEQARVRLRYEARSVAQEALGRLNTLAQGLGTAAQALSTAPGPQVDLASLFPTVPAEISVRLGNGTVVHLAGAMGFPDITAARRQQLADWGRLIVASATHPGRHLLVIGSGAADASLGAALLDERWVFGLDDPEAPPPDTVVCVATEIRAPLCSVDELVDVVARAFAEFSREDPVVSTAVGPQVAWVSELSLDALYDARPWKFVLLRPQSIVRLPIERFISNLLLVVLLTALIVAFISVRQVRRQLRPLQALTEATNRMARQEFDHPVDVKSGDEFEQLGDAFNAMAAQLRQQFADLEAFNIGTLTTLARAIDAKSPWTAGHSERVTEGAVLIAASMGLPDATIDEIRRGGLVHDVGKIATPAEILDKPARLTLEERRIMERHPEQGVHILEPIPAFRSVLPIVGQHHERWDGSGYPAKLSGEAIALTARVVAVADVYDALRSNRPYRSGMPHERCVTIVRAGAGCHFDPAVVEAFLRVEASIDESRSGQRQVA